MNKYYEEIINTIGNTYNHFIDISINKDLSIFNIELGEFAQIKLELINIQQNKDKVLEEINKQSEIILLDVKKVDKGYEIPLYINNKELRYKVVLYCEDIICRIRFWDYSKINISEDENKDNYRVLLAVKEAKNILMKYKIFGDNGLNYIERELIKYALLILILNLLQLEKQYNQEFSLDKEDLLKTNDINIEKIELEQALKALEFYKDKVKGIDKIKEEIVIYLNNLKALVKNDNNYNLKQYKENRYNYPNHCYYYQPIYRIYSDFSIAIKNACKDFEDKHQFPNTKFATNINNYIQNKIIPILKLNEFEGEYPYFIYKDYKKIYIISFEIKENKVVIKYDDKDKSNLKIKSLLENIDYREMKPEDFCVYLTSECLDKESVGDCINQFIDDLRLHKQVEFDQYDDNIIDKPYKKKISILEKIISKFKKEKNK